MPSEGVLLTSVLLTALLQAVSNTVMKVGSDQLVINMIIAGIGAVLAIPLLPFVPLPSPASWPYILGSTIAQTAFLVFRGESYRFGEISRIVPLMRGDGLFSIAGAAAIFADEPIGLRQIAGLAAILLGALSLVLFGGEGRRDGWASMAYAAATGLMLAGFTIFDGFGIRHNGTPFGYLAWLFLISGIPIIVLGAAWRRAGLIRALKQNLLVGSISGLTSTLAYTVVLWAIMTNAFAPIIGLREISLVFTALSGALVLRESFGLRRVFAASIILCGILTLNL